MKLNKGDIVYCKKNYTYTGSTPQIRFRFGNSYIIEEILRYDLIKIDNVYFSLHRDYSFRSFQLYFENEQDQRARKLRMLSIK